MLHDNAPSHRSTLTMDYLTKNRIVTIKHSSYSPDMAPCDFYLFGKLHLAMKGKRYADVDAIQKASTVILNAIQKDVLKKSFDNHLDRANRCIQREGDYFESANKMITKENQKLVWNPFEFPLVCTHVCMYVLDGLKSHTSNHRESLESYWLYPREGFCEFSLY